MFATLSLFRRYFNILLDKLLSNLQSATSLKFLHDAQFFISFSMQQFFTLHQDFVSGCRQPLHIPFFDLLHSVHKNPQ